MEKIAAQMFTVRDYTKTPPEIAESCRKIKAMGYDGIQISAMGPIDPKEMKAILDGEGLACVSTHYGLDDMENNFAEFVAKHQLWGCEFPAIGGFFPPVEQWNNDNWSKFIDRFNAMAKRLAKEGLRLGYHNHDHEFAKLEDGRTPYQRLINELDDSAWIEIDTHWIARGGSEPSAWIRKVAHRIPCIHFKDLCIDRVAGDPNCDKIIKICEVGDGNLCWPEIIDACRFAGVQWYIVERDGGDMEAFASLERSLYNLRHRMGL